MRLGVFGGSFDPVHHGHLAVAEHCRAQAGLDHVLFVPNARQPLKAGGSVASGADRLAMIELAIQQRSRYAASAIELKRGGLSYTIDTLREIHREQPDAELFFLMGADALSDFAAWRQPDTICELACPLVVRRHPPGGADAAAQDLYDRQIELLAPFASPGRIQQMRALAVTMPHVPISSSMIRTLIATGGDWQLFVPPPVAEYIQRNALYVADSISD